jgi:hypothetical protein
MSCPFVDRIPFALALVCLVTSRAPAQENPPRAYTLSASIAGLHQIESPLDEGGNAYWGRVAVSAGVTRRFAPAFAAGVSLRHASESWHMDLPTAFDNSPPWRDLRRNAVGASLELALSHTLRVGVSPSLEWASDAGADPDEALIYGSVVNIAKVFTPSLTLGAGVSVSRQFYSVKTSPFAIVNWKVNERWRVANAPSAGPLGGSGIELRWTLSPDWELAGGGVVRSDRFRLARGASFPGQVGETSSMPVFARLSRKLGPLFRFDLHAGGMANNRLRVKDSDGRELASTRYPFATAIASTLSFRR